MIPTPRYESKQLRPAEVSPEQILSAMVHWVKVLSTVYITILWVHCFLRLAADMVGRVVSLASGFTNARRANQGRERGAKNRSTCHATCNWRTSAAYSPRPGPSPTFRGKWTWMTAEMSHEYYSLLQTSRVWAGVCKHLPACCLLAGWVWMCRHLSAC